MTRMNGTCVALCALLGASVGGSGVRCILAVFHQKYQAVRLDPHRRLLVDHQLKLLEPHVSRHHRCRGLTSSSTSLVAFSPAITIALRGGIPFFSDVQVGMTTVRCRIYCLVSKNDAVD